jgi:sugar lactone lactonase YvrE
MLYIIFFGNAFKPFLTVLWLDQIHSAICIGFYSYLKDKYMKNMIIVILGLLSLTSQPIWSGDVKPYEILKKLDAAPGNITVTVDGRMIVSQHQFYQPDYSVVELAKDSVVPFPNRQLNARTKEPQGLYLDSVLGIRSDSRGIVWMLDNGMRSNVIPKLVAWDSRLNKLHQVIELPIPVSVKGSFVNDFAIDEQRQRAYIADPANGKDAAFIVVDLNTRSARRVLQGHSSVTPEPIYLKVEGKQVAINNDNGTLVKPLIGVNPITLDHNNEWLYYGAMSGTSLYRIKAQELANLKAQDSELVRHVERYSDKPLCDGITIDQANNIYLGELAANAIGVITPDRHYKRLAEAKELAWVDSFSFGAGRELYAVVNQLHRSAVLNAGEKIAKPPFLILKMNALNEGVPGH